MMLVRLKIVTNGSSCNVYSLPQGCNVVFCCNDLIQVYKMGRKPVLPLCLHELHHLYKIGSNGPSHCKHHGNVGTGMRQTWLPFNGASVLAVTSIFCIEMAAMSLLLCTRAVWLPGLDYFPVEIQLCGSPLLTACSSSGSSSAERKSQ